MRRLYNLSLVVCGMVLLSATSGVDFVQAEPERGEPQYGGTVNINKATFLADQLGNPFGLIVNRCETGWDDHGLCFSRTSLQCLDRRSRR